MAITAQQAANKWRDRLVASTQQITDGVNSVSVAPGQKAAAAKQLWLSRVTNAADKWARNTGAVTLEQWKSDMINVGIPRIGTGANAKVGKVESFMTEFLPHVALGVQKIQSMPKGDINMSIARASAMIQHNAGFRRGSR